MIEGLSDIAYRIQQLFPGDESEIEIITSPEKIAQFQTALEKHIEKSVFVGTSKKPDMKNFFKAFRFMGSRFVLKERK